MNSNTEQIVTPIRISIKDIKFFEKIIRQANAERIAIQIKGDGSQINYHMMNNEHTYVIRGTVGKLCVVDFGSLDDDNPMYELTHDHLLNAIADMKEKHLDSFDFNLNVCKNTLDVKVPKLADTKITVDTEELIEAIKKVKKMDVPISLLMDKQQLAVGYARLNVLELSGSLDFQLLLNSKSLANITIPCSPTAKPLTTIHIGSELPIAIDMGITMSYLAPRIDPDHPITLMMPIRHYDNTQDDKVTLTGEQLKTLNKIVNTLETAQVFKISDTSIGISGMDFHHVRLVNAAIGQDIDLWPPQDADYEKYRVSNLDRDCPNLERLAILNLDSYTFHLRQISELDQTFKASIPLPKLKITDKVTVDHAKTLKTLQKIKHTHTPANQYSPRPMIFHAGIKDGSSKFMMDGFFVPGSELIQNEDKVYAETKYDYNYIRGIIDAMPKQTESVTFSYADNTPLLMQFRHPGILVDFYIAPRIDD